MKTGLIFFFLNLSLICQSQIKLLNASLITPEVQIAYIRIDNKIEVVGIEIDSTFHLVISNETLENHHGYFIYKPTKKIGAERLSLIKNNLVVYSAEFKLEYLLDPQFYLGQIRDSMVSKKELSINPGLIGSFEPQLFIANYRVYEFEGNIQKKNGKFISISSITPLGLYDWTEKKFERHQSRNDPSKYGRNKFTKKNLKKINRMKEGEVLNITTVFYHSADSVGRKKTVNLKFIIK